MAADDSVYRLAQLTTWWARPFDAAASSDLHRHNAGSTSPHRLYDRAALRAKL
jgi:hypothetical protein